MSLVCGIVSSGICPYLAPMYVILESNLAIPSPLTELMGRMSFTTNVIDGSCTIFLSSFVVFNLFDACNSGTKKIVNS